MDGAAAEVRRHLARARLFARARRFAAAVLWTAAAGGVAAAAAVLAGFEPAASWASLGAAGVLAVSLVFASLPLKKYSVEVELDAGTGAGGAIMAFATPESARSALRNEVESAALRALSAKGVMSAMRVRLAGPLAAALLGLFLAVAASAGRAAGNEVPDLFASLAENQTAETKPAAAAPGRKGKSYAEMMRKAVESIGKDWKEGRKALALAKLNELLRRARKVLNARRLEREKRLRESGLPPELARALSQGAERLPAAAAGVSPEALKKAAKAVGGELGASLAKAALHEAGSREQLRALREALAVARKLKREEDARLSALDEAAREGEKLAAGLDADEKADLMKFLSGEVPQEGEGGKEEKAELVRKAVASKAWPLAYKTVLIKYAMKGADW